MRHGLLELHKALLDGERERYEQVHGKVTAGKMLQLAFQDPQFAWLRSMSELIVRIDEFLDTDEANDADVETLLTSTRTLLTTAGQSTNFARRGRSAARSARRPSAACRRRWTLRRARPYVGPPAVVQHPLDRGQHEHSKTGPPDHERPVRHAACDAARGCQPD